MGTKDNPGKFDCYASAKPNEPMFVLLARDPLAPILVRLWAALRAQNYFPGAKTEEATRCAGEMEKWRSQNS